MAFKCLHIKSQRQHHCKSACRLEETCSRLGIECFSCFSAYDGLAWLRKNKAEIIAITLPCPDILWSSFRATALLLSPSSYIVAIVYPDEDTDESADTWKKIHGFNYDAEYHIVKLSSKACIVTEVIERLLSREFHIDVSRSVPLSRRKANRDEVPGVNQGSDMVSGQDQSHGVKRVVSDADSQASSAETPAEGDAAIGTEPAQSVNIAGMLDEALLLEAFSKKTDLVAATSFSNVDSVTLQARCRQQSELLRYWERQWDTLLQILGVGLQIGSASRELASAIQEICGLAEVLVSADYLSEDDRKLAGEIQRRAGISANSLENIEEALNLGNTVPLTYISPRLLVSDVLSSLFREGLPERSKQYKKDGKDWIECGHYRVCIDPSVSDYTLLTDRRQFSTFVLNLFLWAESNRELWRQFRDRMLSLAGKSTGDRDKEPEELLELEMFVTADSRLHLRFFEPCGMVWPMELLGTPENPGPLYTSIYFVWPGTQVPMWGLALVRAFAALHQGQVEVTNADEGVYLEVELVGRVTQEQPHESLWSREETSRSLAHILFVEDDERGVRESVFALRRAGFQVLVCDRADRALEAVRHNDFDAMVIDLNLPDMNGTELYRAMVELCPSLSERAVFVTGFLGTGFFIDSELRRFFAENHCLYLAKPYSAMELLRSVKATLSRRPTTARQNLSERVL